MKWIKANEKTPIEKTNKPQHYYSSGLALKVKGVRSSGYFISFDGKIYCEYKATQSRFENSEGTLTEHDFDCIEWLDETESVMNPNNETSAQEVAIRILNSKRGNRETFTYNMAMDAMGDFYKEITTTIKN